ncbi:MAG: type II secretion system F family protein [Phycisphaerae bacterium]
MPAFEYTGQLTSGTAITGTFESDSAEEARARLQEMQIHVSSIAQVPRMRAARPLSREDLQYFNEQLASLAQTGVALDQGLRIIARDIRRGRLRRVLNELADDLERGVPFEEAVSRRSELFPPLYAEVLKAGVRNNQLGSTLFNLNCHLSLMGSMRRLFWESAVYPIIVLLFGLALMTFFMMNVVPEFAPLVLDFAGTEYWDSLSYTSAYLELPGITLALFTLSHRWPVILGVILGLPLVAALVLTLLRRSATGRSFRETLAMLVPGLAGVYRTSLVARFARVAALGVQAGQDLPAVLRMASGATGSRALTRDAERLAHHIESGGLPEQAALQTRILPAIFAYTAHVAGARGLLAQALADLAETYDALARHHLAMFKMFLMPILIVLVATVLGAGVVAMYLPLVQLLHGLSG